MPKSSLLVLGTWHGVKTYASADWQTPQCLSVAEAMTRGQEWGWAECK